MLPIEIRTFIFSFFAAFGWIKKHVYNYKNAVHKAQKSKVQLKFLKTCLDNKVLPKSLLPRKYVSRPGTPFTKAAEEVLKERI